MWPGGQARVQDVNHGAPEGHRHHRQQSQLRFRDLSRSLVTIGIISVMLIIMSECQYCKYNENELPVRAFAKSLFRFSVTDMNEIVSYWVPIQLNRYGLQMVAPQLRPLNGWPASRSIGRELIASLTDLRRQST